MLTNISSILGAYFESADATFFPSKLRSFVMLLIYNFTSYCCLSIQIEISFIGKLDIFPLICAAD
jgi:hypothetical protein